VRRFALLALGLAVAILVGLGLVVLMSASEVRGLSRHADAFYFVKRQVVYIAAGLAVAAAAAAFDYHKWRDHTALSTFFYFAVLVALLAVFLFKATKGSHRWIVLGPVSFQPGEFAKLATALMVAVWVDRASWRIELFKNGALIPASIIAGMAVPVILEPDFGSVMVIGSVGLLVMYVGGTRRRYIYPLLGCGAAVFIWKVFHNANRMARLAAFTGMSVAGGAAGGAADSAAYQGDMSLVAISRGGVLGVGLMKSMQKQNYLPEAWTDFIFAVGAEEMGVAFSVAVVLLFAAFFLLSVYIARKAADRFGRLLVVGMAFIVFFQAMFNIGVVCEALPTKGMALPFFSYGGTNMLASFFAVGTILSVGIRSLGDQNRRPFQRKAR
jgi:cell division protein FtsW